MSKETALARLSAEGLAFEALLAPEFIREVDRGGVDRLILYDSHPCWIMAVDMVDGRLGLYFSQPKTGTPTDLRLFKAIAAIRTVQMQFRDPRTRMVLPFVLDRDFPYDPDRRRRLLDMIS